MTLRLVVRNSLPASASPYRLLDEQDRELAWATNRSISVGKTVSVNSLHAVHSRSPKYCNVTGAFGSPSTVPY